jgi:hypothetical protein
LRPLPIPTETKWSRFFFVFDLSVYSNCCLTRICTCTYLYLYIGVRHGYPRVPTDQGPRGPCQVDPTCQKPCRPASGPRDLIHNPGGLGRHWTTLSRLRKTCRACGASFSIGHGGSAANRSKDRGILSVITEGDLPKSVTDPDEGPLTSNGNPSPPAI